MQNLAKKHGQLKQAIVSMVQECMNHMSKVADLEVEVKIIESLRLVTEGKIYAEVERARLTRRLAKIKEDSGNVEEAASILQELQVVKSD